MRKGLIVLLGLVLAGTASAQEVTRIPRSSSPSGLQLQGNSSLTTSSSAIDTLSAGQNNSADSSAGSIQGSGTQIRGNTRITTSVKDVNTAAIGKGNKADSNIGAIGH